LIKIPPAACFSALLDRHRHRRKGRRTLGLKINIRRGRKRHSCCFPAKVLSSSPEISNTLKASGRLEEEGKVSLREFTTFGSAVALSGKRERERRRGLKSPRGSVNRSISSTLTEERERERAVSEDPFPRGGTTTLHSPEASSKETTSHRFPRQAKQSSWRLWLAARENASGATGFYSPQNR